MKLRRVRMLLALAALVLSACGPIIFHGGPVRDHVSFIDAIRARSLVAEIVGPAPAIAGVRGYGTRVRLQGGDFADATIDSYNYDATDLRVSDATMIAVADADRLRSVRFPAPYHLFRRERVIVLYAGDDAGVRRLLSDLLGAQFAGT